MPDAHDGIHHDMLHLESGPEPARCGASLVLHISDADLHVFNECLARVAPGTPALTPGKLVAAAHRLSRTVGEGNEARFIHARIRRADEVRRLLADDAWPVEPQLLGRMQDLLGYLDGPVALVPSSVPAIGGLDRALLVDVAMEALRVELDEYAEFRRHREAEAARFGIPVVAVIIDRPGWTAMQRERLRVGRYAHQPRIHESGQRDGDADALLHAG